MSAELSYFEKRMTDIGCLPAHRQLLLKWGNEHQSKPRDVVYEDEEGNICFLVYDLDGFVITHDAGDPTQINYKSRVNDLVVKRYKVPKLIKQKDGREKEQKYDIPKGAGTRPFIPPGLMKRFHAGETIETLLITEGYIKALCGDAHGFNIIGLNSITTYKDKKTGTLHPDILRIITERGTKNVVIMYDGDAQKISTKEFDAGRDISMRPHGFLASATNIRELLKDHLGAFECDLYYAQVLSDSVPGDPKGFDDLIVEFNKQNPPLTPPVEGNPAHAARSRQARTDLPPSSQAVEILRNDLFTFSRPGNYFKKFNINLAVSKVREWLHLTSVEDFYGFHQERIGEKEFIYYGTKYKYDQQKQECQVVIPAAAKNYFRVGDHYYEKIEKPNKYNQMIKTFDRRQKSTIIDDHGRNFVNHIPKYKAFCNVPDHVNYQSIVYNCYNVYFPFEHDPENGDCTKTLYFLQHIFGEQFNLGLDYVQLLYQRPTQPLPILCLVSKESNTGKSTLGKWLKAIFTQNMTFVSNSDFANDFNASWMTRLIVCCEESFLEKKLIYEKLKSLSTGDNALMNAKGKDQIEIDIFLKFILFSNVEEHFVSLSEFDDRWWVRKIPQIPAENKNVHLLEEMINEIPAFLNYLQKRQISTKEEDRAWFDPKLLMTEALRKVRMASKPTVERELRMKLREYFLEFGDEMLMMTLPAIKLEFFKNYRYEDSFIRRILTDNLHVDQYHKLVLPNGTGVVAEEAYEPWALPPGIRAGECIKRYYTKRSSYKKREYQLNGSDQTREFVMLEVKENGKPYVFHRSDFVSANDLALHVLEQGVEAVDFLEKSVENSSTITDEQRRVFNRMSKQGTMELPPEKDDLPF